MHRSDINLVLEKRHDNGGNFWESEDGRLAVGSPFSTLESLQILHELGVDPQHEAVAGAIDLILDAWREDGRYRLAPSGTLYPCHTSNTARILNRFGYTEDGKVQRTLAHLLELQHDDGGWRCTKFAFGRGPETEFSNPGVTLFVLDAFRFTQDLNSNKQLDAAVDSLLDHWTVRKPIGPCHFGMGTLFMQIEFPFLRYNLFSYVYVLSFYKRAIRDPRFQEALKALRQKLDDSSRMVIERPHRKLADFRAFAKGLPSDPATARYREIEDNVSRR
jgi:hypothetical protein